MGEEGEGRGAVGLPSWHNLTDWQCEIQSFRAAPIW